MRITFVILSMVRMYRSRARAGSKHRESVIRNITNFPPEEEEHASYSCEDVYTASALNNNTLDLLLVAKVDVAPNPHCNECECSDGGGCNTHIPLSNTKRCSDCVSSR
jgi:hypothetical protein